MAKAKIYITLKKTIMDAQGQTVQRALQSLGFDEAQNLRIGKYLELELDGGDPASYQKRVEDMCCQLLANPIIEEYQVEIVEG